jgi:dolichyl-phosphate beta-glucosyltransferase
VTGLPYVSNTPCGFRFFQRDVAKHIFRLQRIDKYMLDVEILLLAQKLNLRVEEVPIHWRDDNGNG